MNEMTDELKSWLVDFSKDEGKSAYRFFSIRHIIRNSDKHGNISDVDKTEVICKN